MRSHEYFSVTLPSVRFSKTALCGARCSVANVWESQTQHSGTHFEKRTFDSQIRSWIEEDRQNLD